MSIPICKKCLENMKPMGISKDGDKGWWKCFDCDVEFFTETMSGAWDQLLAQLKILWREIKRAFA